MPNNSPCGDAEFVSQSDLRHSDRSYCIYSSRDQDGGEHSVCKPHSLISNGSLLCRVLCSLADYWGRVAHWYASPTSGVSQVGPPQHPPALNGELVDWKELRFISICKYANCVKSKHSVHTSTPMPPRVMSGALSFIPITYLAIK